MKTLSIDPKSMLTFELALQTFAFGKLEEEAKQAVFQRAIALVRTIAEAIELWGETEQGSEEEEQVFVHMLALARIEEDFELICGIYADEESMLRDRNNLRRIFDR
ncbi:MAG: hypothetical protein Q8O19_06055, partial [Rectinemataceae bacterium]|nr:hypothetical protein [Rectinemataceae bacterium]